MITCQAVPSLRTLAYSHEYTPCVIWVAIPAWTWKARGRQSALAESSRDLPGGSVAARARRGATATVLTATDNRRSASAKALDGESDEGANDGHWAAR
jgi:predicted kinase